MRVHIGHAKEGDIISFQYNDSANPNVANLNRPKPLTPQPRRRDFRSAPTSYGECARWSIFNGT